MRTFTELRVGSFQMAGEQAATVGRPRPQLKGHHAAYMKRHLYIGIAVSLAAVVIAKYTINEPRKRAYAEYYK